MNNNTNNAGSINSAESASSQVQMQQQKAEKKSITESRAAARDEVKMRTKFSSPVKTAIIAGLIIILGALVYVNKGLFIAATVDGSPITRLDVIKKLEKASGKSLLESLIVEKLIQNEAKTKKIVVSNDEIETELKKIEDEVAMQGNKLDAVLSERGMTRDDLKKQIVLNKEMEKLLADKVNIADEEVEQYIKDNKISIPPGQEATTRTEIKEGMRSQKLNTEAQAMITELKSRAKIKYFVNY